MVSGDRQEARETLDLLNCARWDVGYEEGLDLGSSTRDGQE